MLLRLFPANLCSANLVIGGLTSIGVIVSRSIGSSFWKCGFNVAGSRYSSASNSPLKIVSLHSCYDSVDVVRIFGIKAPHLISRSRMSGRKTVFLGLVYFHIHRYSGCFTPYLASPRSISETNRSSFSRAADMLDSFGINAPHLMSLSRRSGL
jgi:hypothetical protein